MPDILWNQINPSCYCISLDMPQAAQYFLWHATRKCASEVKAKLKITNCLLRHVETALLRVSICVQILVLVEGNFALYFVWKSLHAYVIIGI